MKTIIDDLGSNSSTANDYRKVLNLLQNYKNGEYQITSLTKEQAKEKLNKNLNIQSEMLAIIPTEWKTERLCYEFKGKVENTDYLVYINAETGAEEEILIITNTPNGQLTM